MTITWLGHSCFYVDTGLGSLVLDPYEPNRVPGLALPPLEADAVFCSHEHGDHSYSQIVSLSGKRPGFSITQVDSFHDDAGGALRGGNTLTLVDAQGVRMLHLGDLGCALSPEQLEALGRVDLLMVPVGGHYTLDARGAMAAVEALRPRTVIPMHYRGPGFGYPVIATVEDFAALAPKPCRLDTNSLTIEGRCPEMTAIFKLPDAVRTKEEGQC